MAKLVLFATANQHKIKEVQQILGNQYKVDTPANHGLTEDIPENELTLQGNALAKAQYVYDRLGIDCFADDTGLEVDALDGAPGVFSARYAGESKSSEANIQKLLRELEGKENRKARFRTVIAYVTQTETRLFEGEVQGTIISTPVGKDGFGYDPVFVPENCSETFAQMSAEQKNGMSHRGRAIQKLISYLNEIP